MATERTLSLLWFSLGGEQSLGFVSDFNKKHKMILACITVIFFPLFTMRDLMLVYTVYGLAYASRHGFSAAGIRFDIFIGLF